MLRRMSKAAILNESPKQRPGLEVQSQKIVQAAKELYAHKGIEGVPVEEILKAAGVSRDTFYRCFKDKEALLTAIHSEAVTVYIENANKLSIDESGTIDALKAYVDRGFDLVVDMGDLALTLLHDSRREGLARKSYS